MEDIKIGEQLDQPIENVQSGIVENLDEGTACLESESGSLGKFKDVESILKSYNNLQAEFTRKCQKLSELTKIMEQNGYVQSEELTEIENEKGSLSQDAQKQDAFEQSNGESEQSSILGNDQNVKEAESKPIFESEDWKQKVSAFLNQNSEAKEYSGEIANEIMTNKDLQTSPHALELAWARVMQKEYKNPKILAQDQNFINEQILSREEIKKQVLEEYFKNLQNKKSPPLISSSGMVAGITYREPTTMQEAKQAVARLFNLKGN